MRRRFDGTVVVVTGASSGIGRATAVRFARKGATVVLAARRGDALEEVAAECDRAGGRGLAVPTDVTDVKAVEELARRADSEFGRIDVWVNNAAVSLFAPFEEAPVEEYERVIETNLLGYTRGAREALRRFRAQGHGVLINNASVYGKAGAPYISAYVASKFGVVGLSECLRTELVDDERIHVCTVLPASIDTPIFRHAANYTGRALKPLDPVYDADVVAKAIVHLARRPRRERIVGGAGRLLRKQRLTTPGAYERMSARMVHREHFRDEPAPRTSGNVNAPVSGWTSVSGGWDSSPAPLRRAALSAGMLAGAVLARRAWAGRSR